MPIKPHKGIFLHIKYLCTCLCSSQKCRDCKPICYMPVVIDNKLRIFLLIASIRFPILLTSPTPAISLMQRTILVNSAAQADNVTHNAEIIFVCCPVCYSKGYCGLKEPSPFITTSATERMFLTSFKKKSISIHLYQLLIQHAR